jgi:hypothetical protein
MKMEVDASSYTVEWYSVTSRDVKAADTLTVERTSTISLSAPFAASGPTVVYLRKGRL